MVAIQRNNMADHHSNHPDRRRPPAVPGDAAKRMKAAQIRAEKDLAEALDAFWRNNPAPERVSPKDLVPLFRQYAETLFKARAEEYMPLFDDAGSFEDFLHWELPEVVVKEILPPTRGSKPPGSSDVIGLRESLGEYKARIGKVDRSSEFSKSEDWERVTGIPFADVGAGSSKCDEIWERLTGEAAGYGAGFSKTEGDWERLTEDACVKAIRRRLYSPYSDALVWALRDSQNCSDVREILLVSLQEQWRDFVARLLDQAAKSTLVDVSPSGAGAPVPPPHSTGESQAEAVIPEAEHVGEVETAPPAVGSKKRGRPQTIPDERKAEAQALRDSGGTNRDAAAKLYDTKHPTPQQVKNASSILREYRKKQSKQQGSSIPASPKSRKNKG